MLVFTQEEFFICQEYDNWKNTLTISENVSYILFYNTVKIFNEVAFMFLYKTGLPQTQPSLKISG